VVFQGRPPNNKIKARSAVGFIKIGNEKNSGTLGCGTIDFM